MQVTLSDLAAVAGVVEKVDPNPVFVAGRALGLTPEEQRAVPVWAWWAAVTLLAVGAGAYVAKRTSQ